MFTAHELQICRAAGALGRAGSPLPAASLERTRAVLSRRRAGTDARLGVRGLQPAFGNGFNAMTPRRNENYPKGITAISPALDDLVGLRWVTNQNESQP